MKSSNEFIKLETIGANLLLGATILALILCNSPWYAYYEKIFQNPFVLHLGYLEFKTNLLFLINEGLMSIFFLVVGLEIKYELLEGALNSYPKAILPAIAAVGGMMIPALIYIGFNYHDTLSLRGWAIPTATDIAFALSVLSLLGKAVRTELKVFLTALAIFDDLAAIIIIALFYSASLSVQYLGLAWICLGILLILNVKKINSLLVYSLVGGILWVSLLKTGVNPTVAGVALALFVPLNHSKNNKPSPLKKLKNLLHPSVALGILPLFAFANAGISFLNISVSGLHFNIALGIFLSLLVGKQVGVFSACWLAVKLGMAQLPNNIRWQELYGVSIVCGIGFTMSLFIGLLAFGRENGDYGNSVKIGVLSGSLVSGIAGYIWLSLLKRKGSG